ncbi:hypothetical protein [Pontibacter sp. G13]|uniref:hypothetical protein n=1 Tax=Pontibacter sp. G13 TaxID=3074898 RepID=UPI00288B0C7D|nr:hypothetical protein [Pontibacter sp. G13]WNJ16431.1 hypothetical protein RJD25_16320 [Pontibacter sp. G13]
MGNFLPYENLDYVGLGAGVIVGCGPAGGKTWSAGYLKGMGYTVSSSTEIGAAIGAGGSIELAMLVFYGNTVATVENFEGEGFIAGASWKYITASYFRSADNRWRGFSGGIGVDVADIVTPFDLLRVTPHLLYTRSKATFPERINLQYQLREKDWNTNLIKKPTTFKKFRLYHRH